MIPRERSKHIGQTTTPHRTAPASATTSIWPTSRPAAVRDARDDPRGMLLRRSRWHPAHTWTPSTTWAAAPAPPCVRSWTRLRRSPASTSSRRSHPGVRDPSWIVSSGETAARDLGWTMRYSLTQNGGERLLLEAIARPASRNEPSACRDWPFVTPGASTPEHLEGLR
jgi:hypothetical protein